MALVGGLGISAQELAEPKLSELDSLRISANILRMEVAQLKAQAAQRDFDDARAALAATLKAVEVPGYTFDLQTMAYVKAIR